MALPSDHNQSASENIPPVRPAVVGWVQAQSLQEKPSSPATAHQHKRVDRSPSCVGQATQVRVSTDSHASVQESCPPAKRVYDIPTLLRLKETQSAVPVMLRVKPEAIAENIFQYMGAATSRRQPPRSRILSDVSNSSMGNTQPFSHSTYSTVRPKYVTQPLRQPYAPPETSILQRHDGFVRFLKQHASPPSHRVTAGGRIVPAGPSSPPPMLDFGSLNELVRDHPATTKSFQNDSRSSQSNARVQDPKPTSSITLGDYLRSRDGDADGMSVQPAAQPSSTQSANPFNNLPFGYQPFMASVLQAQPTMVPLGMFPDGSTLVSYNGINYRAAWNGMSMTLEPFQPLQLPLDQQYYTQAYPQGQSNSTQYGSIAQSTVPAVLLSNAAWPEASQAGLSLQHKSQNDDALSLKAQLTDLDKHLALYHYDITPVDRASMIAQRRSLVEEIDRIRLSKEKPKHSIPIIAPSTAGLEATPADRRDLPPKGGNVNRHLSPAAPAFVPRKTSNFLSAAIGTRTASQQSKHERVSVRVSSGGDVPAPQAKDIGKFSWTSHIDDRSPFVNAQKISHNEKSSSSSVLDPSDPAMRVIEYEDIEYAARYQYNWTKDTKTYCTTVAEFQEAVRRVREQARLYGCAGGQSKDPAYDAEQDLWWAICDRDPIPLPSRTPDHVSNPRPWNWNDSAFNYRRQVGNDTLEPGCEQARNSPRVLGWDPATTDMMKNDIDVSRSYFALKGRLPSVSFRDFAYDQEGNKRRIQSDTAAYAAYAANPRMVAHLDKSTAPDSQRKRVESRSFSDAPKELSSSELNIRRGHSTSKPQSKDLGAISQSPASPHTPMNRRSQKKSGTSDINSTSQVSNPNLSSAHGVAEFKNFESAEKLYHAHVEDYPETPQGRGNRSASKEAISNQIGTGPVSINKSHTLTGAPVQASMPHPTGDLVSTYNPTKEDLNSIWYQTPLDEVTQKYIDDMKAYNPFKHRQPGENNSSLIIARDLPQSSDLSEPVAESKSPWGPEKGSTSNLPIDQTQLKYTRAEETGMSPVARVKIPNASPLRAPIPRINSNINISAGLHANDTLNSRELSAVNVPTLENSDSRLFLREMLKSPRYTSTQPISVLGQISSALVNKFNGTKRTQVNLTENISEKQGKMEGHNLSNTSIIGGGPSTVSSPSNSTFPAKAASNLAASKAQSSLASSTFQAHGFLPQFEGAGKAHTSSVFREQGIQPHPQVRLPSEEIYSDNQHASEIASQQIQNSSTYMASTPYHTAVNFGYDGGRDSPSPKTANVPRGQQSTRPAFDTMGVTSADYENKREDTNNAWHHGQVDDYFQDVRERELQKIASYQRVKTRNAG